MPTAMAIYILIINCMLIASFSFAQNNGMYHLHDVYGLEVTIEDKISQEECDCCTRTDEKGNLCSLYKIRVNDVIFHRDSSVYSNKIELSKIQFLVIKDFQFDFNVVESKKYVITAYNSCSDRYLIASKIHNDRSELYLPSFYVNLPYLRDLRECRDRYLTKLEKKLIQLKLYDVNKYLKRHPILHEENHLFVQKILEYESDFP